jgi:hypothetical protein
MSGRLRVFVSSTCHDLFQERRDIREALLELGHEVIVSDEPSSIPVSPFLHSYDTCLEAIRKHADLVVVVVNRRYGGTDSGGRSITLLEMREARKRLLPCFVFVRRTTLDILPLWQARRDGSFEPHVEDNRVFEVVDEVRRQTTGNWLFPFESSQDLCATLRAQLSALLRSLLARPTAQARPISPRATDGARKLRSTNPETRREGARVLAEHRCIPELLDALGHSKAPTRTEAALACASFACREALPHIVAGLEDRGLKWRSGPVIDKADEALLRYGPDWAPEILRQRMRLTTRGGKERVDRVLTKIAGPSDAPELLRQYRSGEHALLTVLLTLPVSQTTGDVLDEFSRECAIPPRKGDLILAALTGPLARHEPARSALLAAVRNYMKDNDWIGPDVLRRVLSTGLMCQDELESAASELVSGERHRSRRGPSESARERTLGEIRRIVTELCHAR